MIDRRLLLNRGLAALVAGAFLSPLTRASAEGDEITHSVEEWRKLLTPAQFAVLRQDGTESPFSSPLDHETRPGRYSCAGCDLPAFSSSAKYDSGTGWPSFWKPLQGAIVTRQDNSLGMTRTAVNCRRCAGHLGHVFEDGPQPTGLRYCMNGVALKFAPGPA